MPTKVLNLSLGKTILFPDKTTHSTSEDKSCPIQNCLILQVDTDLQARTASVDQLFSCVHFHTKNLRGI